MKHTAINMVVCDDGDVQLVFADRGDFYKLKKQHNGHFITEHVCNYINDDEPENVGNAECLPEAIMLAFDDYFHRKELGL